ncbi:vesicle tethering protein [Plasmopara halstedii]|uniref:Vesicle tethering protein n=1 Tax=Plasmopara halstedii TaxID=4781 RepID=A0A0P1B854_PLAHL|nr:vesicle tethering protein [Plasmopara halstedii]CEG50431.1 vesicle tethering protein [Plasmopara halstedii]|eukprot:XP_024586800.1 vesicle tethering protein [Plasmopara halstedii]
MQALLSRIAVGPPQSETPSESISTSVDTSTSSFLVSSPLVSQKATNIVLPTISTAVKAEITLAVERLQFATLLGERKKAINALLLLAQKLNTSENQNGKGIKPTNEEHELGTLAVPAILTALVSDPRDTELMEAMLELLQYIVSQIPSVALLLLEQPLELDIWGMQTTLTLLQDPSPWIRGPAISLIKTLQDAEPRAFAKSVCECKEGLRRLLEVVEDRREHIRDTALTVLGQLTGHDKNAQQFLAFEDGFGRLFQIMEIEGLTEIGARDASTVVADCLQIVNNMVRDNLMTQTLFLEMPYLESHVPKILRLSSQDEEHLENESVVLTRRKRVLKLGLQLVRFLVAGLYEGVEKSTLDEIARRDQDRKCQDLARMQSLIARQEALMGAVGELVCCSQDALTDLRLQALDLLRLVSEHNNGAQMILISLYAVPSGRNVLAELVNLDVGMESDESPVAAAASGFLDSLFQGNEGARMAVFQHIHTPSLLPTSVDVNDINDARSPSLSAGRVLLDSLIENIDYISQYKDHTNVEMLTFKLIGAWKASCRLTNLLANSSYCKELLLRVPAEYSNLQARAVTGGLFLSRCLRSIRSLSGQNQTSAVQSIKFQAQISLLLLLIRWCHDCPKAIREIIGSLTNLSVLIDILSEQHESVSQREISEMTQIRGLIALLLGCCLEFLGEDDEEKALKLAKTDIPATMYTEPKAQMTRDQFLQMISKRVSLEQLTDSMIQFQQCPTVLACARVSTSQSSRVPLIHRTTYDLSDTGESSSDNEKAQYLFLLYERSFTIYYREMAERIQKRIIAIYSGVDSESTVVDSGTSNAISAYQDLIRMQDNQLQSLKRQVIELQEQRGTSCNKTAKELCDQVSLDRFEAQREQFERDKADLKDRNETLSRSVIDLETRLKGLTVAYELLERENQQSRKEVDDCSKVDGLQSLLKSSEVNEELATLQAALDTERDEKCRLRSEAAAGESGSTKLTLGDEPDAELANVRLVMQLEDLRVENEQKGEQVTECNEMLEMLTEGQALVKTENEMLKVQLAEAQAKLKQYENGCDVNTKSIVDELMEEKVQLERRIDELETAACVAYEQDQEVLQQRIQEVEQARRASPPMSEGLDGTSCDDENLPTELVSSEVHASDSRINRLVSSQLEEIKELRALVTEMESVATEREAKIQDRVANFDVESRREKDKYAAKVRELEDELARGFLEKKDSERKAKAAIKELEKEVARLFLAKVELEKELTQYRQVSDENDVQETTKKLDKSKIDNHFMVDDLLVLVASLEIQCSVLRETLKQYHGEDAVAVAAELSRQRGAVVSI